MIRTSISAIPEPLPEFIRHMISDAPVFDSSCSQNARVYMIDLDDGYYLKTASAGTLQREAELTQYFHRVGFGPAVIAYESAVQDFLLTARIPGEDCIHRQHLSEPKKLCDILAETLRILHDTSAADCPVTIPAPILPSQDHLSGFDPGCYLGCNPFSSPSAAWALADALAPALQPDVLIHGDYCLPNVILKNWKFSGLIDLGSGGFGNRHRDLFWGLWSLCYNLKTDRYTRRFLDCYGNDCYSPDLLRAVAALEGFGIG